MKRLFKQAVPVPQPVEVPPNIEAKQIVLLFSTLLSHSPNPPLLMDDLKHWFFSVIGRPFADTICMILVVIRMKVLAEKRKELSGRFYH